MKTTGIPCCYYPTTILLVDDDEQFLDILKDSIKAPYKLFHSPYSAIKFLLNDAVFASLEKIYLTDEHDYYPKERVIRVDIDKIHEQLYNPQRFNEVSVIVIDYQMPGMNGVEFARAIRNYDIKIIMLTGEAGLDLAVDAFNNSIIDKFIRKDTFHLHQELLKAIVEMQFKHFQKISRYVIDSLQSSNLPIPSFLQSENFISFFKDILLKNQIIEYYLLNNFGDFIMLNKTGEISYLVVRDDETFEDIISIAQDEYLQEPSDEARQILEVIKKKEQIPFLWNLQTAAYFYGWPKYMYPVKTEVCADGEVYYHALITDDQFDRGINLSKISLYR